VFFRQKLHGFREPSAPFGLLDTRGDGGRVDEARQLMEPALSTRVREETRKYGVSAARLFHAAYGLVVAQSCGRDDVVYGTVLLAAQRRRAQAQSMLGLFVNTLPLRLPIADLTVSQFVRLTSRELEELLAYQQSSLALAQRCSGVVSPLPLFTAVLNYRNSVGHTVADPTTRASAPGIRLLEQNYRTHYPVTFTVDNLGEDFALIAQTERPIDPRRMIGYVQNALRALLDALGTAPDTPALGLPVVPVSERGQLAMGASIAGGNAGGSKAAAPAREYEPPEGEIERIVATAWQEVLEVDRVGREDDFFGLGGQSLPAMEAIDLIAERLSIEIPLEVLFEYPTVRQLAVQIAELTQRPASAPAALRAEIT
jgi:acyl carrier protein